MVRANQQCSEGGSFSCIAELGTKIRARAYG